MKVAAQNRFPLILAAAILIVIFVSTISFRRANNDRSVRNTDIQQDYELAQGSLVEDFPDMPQHPDSEVLSSSSRDEGDSIEYSATLHLSELTPEQTADWYDDRLVSEGYDFYDLYEGPEELDVDEGGYEIRVTQENIGYVFRIIESADSGTEIIISATIDMD